MAFNLFNSVQIKKPKRNTFDLSHDVKLTCDMGNLVPIMVQEAVPGDTFQISCDSLLRFAPLVAPVMHRIDVSMHYFFVPNRILWPGWENFITGNSELVHPFVTINDETYTSSPLCDYMGVPLMTSAKSVNALPFAAYQRIYNEWYRSQDLIPEVASELVNGDNSTNADLLIMRRRAWQHDYFTASLPFAQKGPSVDIPIGEGTVKLTDTLGQTGVIRRANDHTAMDAGAVSSNAGGSMLGGSTQSAAVYDPQETLVTESGPASIQDLRRAFRLQEWLEKNARAGTRYVESVLAHFGVRSDDARLNRPEYITGTKSPVIISEVLNSTGETDGLPQGNMAGHGISVTSGKYGKYFAKEHGYIIGVMSIMPLPAYQQGMPKHFLRNDRFDYFWPEFANIGEQEVLNQEIYVNHTSPDGTFGYVPRYAEYKYTPSRVAGNFKNNLDFWHLGRIFATQPSLNKSFVECDPGKRIFAVTDPNTNSLYVQVLNKVLATRLMPKYGTPFM